AGDRKGGRGEVQAALDRAPDSADGVAEVLAAAVAWARSLGVDAEVALRDHTQARLLALPDPEEG
ncbi:nucleoside triphosphate hydrolase, partial [Deinococcus sp. MIMF12]|nr:nucleoside triphosphate hydrolase [Deinococcus rhizophilus]